MALEDSTKPQVRYARETVVTSADDTFAKALELARKVEELLEDTRSMAPPALLLSASSAASNEARAHSTRMARAMAASLVDELENLVRAPRSKNGVA